MPHWMAGFAFGMGLSSSPPTPDVGYQRSLIIRLAPETAYGAREPLRACLPPTHYPTRRDLETASRVTKTAPRRRFPIVRTRGTLHPTRIAVPAAITPRASAVTSYRRLLTRWRRPAVAGGPGPDR